MGKVIGENTSQLICAVVITTGERKRTQMVSGCGGTGSGKSLIRKLSNKELIRGLNRQRLSADELRQLGDLYQQCGETERAIEYLYRAAEELSLHHVGKALAVYKKILNMNPSEMKACERIIAILSGQGLLAEEIRYLSLMAHYYERRNDILKAASVFRRILALDPNNAAAVKYFDKGKVRT